MSYFDPTATAWSYICDVKYRHSSTCTVFMHITEAQDTLQYSQLVGQSSLANSVYTVYPRTCIYVPYAAYSPLIIAYLCVYTKCMCSVCGVFLVLCVCVCLCDVACLLACVHVFLGISARLHVLCTCKRVHTVS